MLLQPVLGQLPRGAENAEGDREIEAAAFFGQVGGCQVDSDTSVGEIKV